MGAELTVTLGSDVNPESFNKKLRACRRPSGRGNASESPSSGKKKKQVGASKGQHEAVAVHVRSGRDGEATRRSGEQRTQEQGWPCGASAARSVRTEADALHGDKGTEPQRRKTPGSDWPFKWGLLFVTVFDFLCILYRFGLSENPHEDNCSIFCTCCRQL